MGFFCFKINAVFRISQLTDDSALSAQSSLSIFAQKYLRKCEDTYFILQNKYLRIDEDSFGAKILRDDCALDVSLLLAKAEHIF